MHDLQLAGVHDDGEHVVLTGTDGQKYRLRIDERLRAAVRRDRARLGQLEIEIAGGVRPRDIQARIRAGETAEEVAESAGLPLEHVRRYEGPVLAERQHVAGLARRAPSRQVADRPPFGELVVERLTARGVDTDGTVWDAWRREGSTWTVELAFRAGSKDRRAQWAFDVQRSHLEPLDDEARWLSAEPNQQPAAPGRRLAAVTERVYDVEADGGVRPVSLHPSAAESEEAAQSEPAQGETEDRDTRTLDLLDALRGRRGRRQAVLVEDDLDDLTLDMHDVASLDPFEILDGLVGLPPAAHPPASRPEEAVDAEVLELPELPGPSGLVAGKSPAVAEEAPDDAANAPEAEPTEPSPPPPARRGRRASVPSWDEIVFGAKRE
jgi:hypothetical protein